MSDLALVFPSEEALIAALTSELIPAALQTQGVRYLRSAGSPEITIWPDSALDAELVRRICAAGAKKSRARRRQSARYAGTWPQVIEPRPDPSAEPLSLVLFVIGPMEEHEQGERRPAAQRSNHGDMDDSRGADRDADRASGADAGGRARETEASLLGLAAELLRLGCDRATYQLAMVGQTPLAFVRVFAPPYYTVAAAGEPGARYRVFVPAPTGQTRTWIELGYRHPMTGAITPAAGQLHLITGAGAWLSAPDGPWRDVFGFIELTLPGNTHELSPLPPPQPLKVSLRLAAATRTEPPSLWVLRDDAIACVERLVRSLPDEVIARLLFAVLDSPGGGGNPLVVLRARHGRSGPPQIDVASVDMVPMPGIGNLYLPRDAIVEPPLSHDKLRDLLAPDHRRLYWLAPGRGGTFTVESVPDRSFAPLTDWVEYIVHTSADKLEPWVRAVTFEFESFQSIGTEWAQAADLDTRGRREPEIARPQRRSRPEVAVPSAAASEGEVLTLASDEAIGEPQASAVVPVPVRETSEVASELAALERAFLDMNAAADAPERLELWLRMARLLGQLDRHRDAALCFVRALWDQQEPRASAVLDEWAAAEAAGLRDHDDDASLTGAALAWLPLVLGTEREPNRDQAVTSAHVRTVATRWIAAGTGDRDIGEPPERGVIVSAGRLIPLASLRPSWRRDRAVQAVREWLDRHDDNLDVRSLWLLRRALADRAGGDPLALARVRDRILTRLRGGLSIERDVPTFLRFVGGAGTGDSVAVARLTASLDGLRETYERTPRKRALNEQDLRLTDAYVHLVLAYGFARLGQGERARALRQQATARLDQTDPTHNFLTRAYAARIDQALEGMPPETPLPAALTGVLGAMDTMARYRVNQLRQHSAIIEPQERVSAIHSYLNDQRRQGDDPLDALRAAADPTALAGAIDGIFASIQAASATQEERSRLLDGAMDALTRLGEAQAAPRLRAGIDAARALPPPLRVLVLEKALMLAGYFGRLPLAAEVAQAIGDVVGELAADDAASLAQSFGASLRSMRRVGLREHAARLISAMAAVVQGESVPALEARIHLAAGLAHLGDMDRARPMVAGIQAALPRMNLRGDMDRVRLAKALAEAWSQLPEDEALAGLGELAGELGKITDNRSTNSHFSLSVVVFMEALVLGYARSDLALGELGRRWLEEDEFLVRRRINRELGERL